MPASKPILLLERDAAVRVSLQFALELEGLCIAADKESVSAGCGLPGDRPTFRRD